MACGLYGKLPSKRDFIAIGAPRDFLAVWEPWLQGGVSASRMAMGSAWQEAFLRAPIWRFWLGGELSGGPIAGAFMPSVDGIGRYFPLTVFGRGDGGTAVPPPELDDQAAWFERAEDLLLSALAPDVSFDAVSDQLAALPTPAGRAQSPFGGAKRLSDGTLSAELAGSLPQLLGQLRLTDHARFYAMTSFWWTIGGEGFEPRALVAHRMPDPHLFAGMLTGRFDGMT